MSIFSKIKTKKNIEKAKEIGKIVAVSAVVSLVISCLTSRGSLSKRDIEKDPKFIVDAIEKMYQQEQQKQQKEASKKAPEVAKEIVKTSKSVLGNKDGSQVIVEFFDYNCGHCKRQSREFKNLLTENKNVKLVLVDLPILSQNSLLAAQVGIYIALNENSKLDKYYDELSKHPADLLTIKNVLKKLKISESIIEKAKKDEKVKSVIEQNYAYAKEIGVQGTPALIINGKFVGGMVSANDISSMLK